ncbi:hypothetical protein PPERSA_03329 [Pseudocohnilembus persalinus]|uniref:Uncharacterized protein n=1 Tax=Pseudocohnilembus persalinus TaxID=266149 RepID=A0A0V0Q8C9_PSEPJ|nr:hypothetical protein PPERSA_03329 [Pseudocohnilembus persalinus]|eukprot:KRW98498.1 hypothetical protein PPERSA_03329 [Pseudocohnilembus persalinus]
MLHRQSCIQNSNTLNIRLDSVENPSVSSNNLQGYYSSFNGREHSNRFNDIKNSRSSILNVGNSKSSQNSSVKKTGISDKFYNPEHNMREKIKLGEIQFPELGVENQLMIKSKDKQSSPESQNAENSISQPFSSNQQLDKSSLMSFYVDPKQKKQTYVDNLLAQRQLWVKTIASDYSFGVKSKHPGKINLNYLKKRDNFLKTKAQTLKNVKNQPDQIKKLEINTKLIYEDQGKSESLKYQYEKHLQKMGHLEMLDEQIEQTPRAVQNWRKVRNHVFEQIEIKKKKLSLLSDAINKVNQLTESDKLRFLINDIILQARDEIQTKDLGLSLFNNQNFMNFFNNPSIKDINQFIEGLMNCLFDDQDMTKFLQDLQKQLKVPFSEKFFLAINKFVMDIIQNKPKYFISQVEFKLNKLKYKAKAGITLHGIIKEYFENIEFFMNQFSKYFSDWMGSFENNYSMVQRKAIDMEFMDLILRLALDENDIFNIQDSLFGLEYFAVTPELFSIWLQGIKSFMQTRNISNNIIMFFVQNISKLTFF